MVPLLCFVGISSIEDPFIMQIGRLDVSVHIHRPDVIKVEPGMKSLKPNLPSRTAPAIGGTMKGFRSDL